MNSNRSSRAQATISTFRRWLGETMQAAHRTNDSRPLLCERLESRYALHGMNWWGESAERFEYAEAIAVEDAGAGDRFAQLRTWQVGYQSSVRPEPKYLDSYATSETFALDASLEDMFSEPCDRPHGSKPEGEQGPGSLFNHNLGRGGEAASRIPVTGSIPNVVNEQISSKPLPKISEWVPPKLDSGKNDPVGLHEANTSLSPTNSTIANDTALEVHVTAVQPATTTTGSTQPALVTPRLIDFITGSRNLSASQNTNGPMNGRSSFTPSASVTNRVDASPSLTNSNAPVTTLTSPISQLQRSTTSTTATSTLSNNDNDAPVSIGNSWQHDRPGTSADRVAKSERDTEGLQSELKSVIENLASDPAVGKTGPGSHVRTSGSLGSRNIDELFSANRQRGLFDDGMLELAANNDQLSLSEASVESVHQSTGEAQLRSQLIASLELNREFDLAGQSVKSLKSVIDPTTLVHDAGLATEEIESWNNQPSSSVSLTAKPVEAESTLWQRSILPLAFLAIGGLLIRSRKKFNARRASE